MSEPKVLHEWENEHGRGRIVGLPEVNLGVMSWYDDRWVPGSRSSQLWKHELARLAAENAELQQSMDLQMQAFSEEAEKMLRRADDLRAEVKAQAEEIERLREALEWIDSWCARTIAPAGTSVSFSMIQDAARRALEGK